MSRPEVVGIGLARETDTHGMSTHRTKLTIVALVAAATLVLPACTSTVAGTPALSADRSTSATSTTQRPAPTTPRTDPYADLTKTVQAATLDVSRFWASEGVMVPTRALVVTDPYEAPCAASRDAEKEAQAVAWACDMTSPQAVVVRAENMADDIDRPFSDTGVYIVIAHEQGHIGLPLLDPATDTDDNTEEKRADCAAGSYFSWVVADKSPSVSVTESEVANTTGAMWQSSAPDRQRAFVHGYVNGLKSCLTYRP